MVRYKETTMFRKSDPLTRGGNDEEESVANTEDIFIAFWVVMTARSGLTNGGE